MENVHPYSLFTDQDIYLFREGNHHKLYEKFGSHSVVVDGIEGVYFSVWAPFAKEVSVIGDFNKWHSETHKLLPRWDESGIWEGFIAGLKWGDVYKYGIRTNKGVLLEKGDPFAVSWEQNLQAGSLVSTTWFEWNDNNWMSERWKKNSLKAPMSVYEIHLGSWMRGTDDPDKFFNYREIAERLVPYIKEMEFTHVEFMPVMEYPYDPSWGYQVTGFFAATSRFGSPQDLMFLINELHNNDIGVLLDWVPSHFPGDANGLHFFDGTFLYEHEDPRKGFHPDWKSYIFNYGRPEVKSFLISNALFWLDRYHADGLRVDAVTSMLHLDYSRNEGEWEPNIYGGNVNLEAKKFLQDFNKAVYKEFPDIITIAEESSDFPMLTKPVYDGGIGFGMKWMMGWMHDTLNYFKEDPIDRKYQHNKLTFGSMYVYNENYMMPLSHDEVVHGKASLIYKMPGDEWQKFANLRALYLYMFTHPGAKLLFMGNEFAQTREWNFTQSLDWHLLDYSVHKGMHDFVKKLNYLYRNETALYENNFSPDGMEWVEANDADNSIYIYLRKGKSEDDVLMVVLNLTPRVFDYKIGVDEGTNWEVILNSDDEQFAGSGVIAEIVDEEDDEWMYKPNAIVLKLPPLSGVILRQKKKEKKAATRKITSVKKSVSEKTIPATAKVETKNKTEKKSLVAKSNPLKTNVVKKNNSHS
ncbi:MULTISPECIES: 1,4-alpha-glucan branching protein GlgB [unclassified Kaistella]|uniref:1,4-alpha-glucan branching protein GlgB n=1 Tax=unclassified Kaistella TaxID=2762626 RepID=UPI0027330AD3|nr:MULTISPECIES: 1,4-alpha-glucan branching protein GlgB [unclassified Kaistella]MDP2453200.1 1,4-alpha-glucan branching protein GlgB [Kaistella sp. SH11-4b]MDP2456257.1 1,4-alpha-glucan branching protein GlgB [Kaistella sp. SH40-3]MDP2459013.1 1,4-alpha-glucan branching protein GlgB [Kaistella sp. SH19-2b]